MNGQNVEALVSLVGGSAEAIAGEIEDGWPGVEWTDELREQVRATLEDGVGWAVARVCGTLSTMVGDA